MAARRWENSLRVFAALTREIFFSTRGEKFRISKRPCNVLFIIYTNIYTIFIIYTNEIPTILLK